MLVSLAVVRAKGACRYLAFFFEVVDDSSKQERWKTLLLKSVDADERFQDSHNHSVGAVCAPALWSKCKFKTTDV